MISPHTLSELINYDPKTGILHWKTRSRAHFNSDRACSIWNAQNAGNVCGRLVGGYRRIKVFNSSYLAHRIAWTIVIGEWPVGEVDHINGDRDDNRAMNLRTVTHETNARNRPIHATNTSGYPGVYRTVGGRWYAQIQFNGKRRHLGYFPDFNTAKAARLMSENQHGYIVRGA